jgi:uncharacterized protein (AIM24 family)
MSRYSVREFLAKTAQNHEAREPFELENPYTLELNLNGMVRAKLGAMVAYAGNVRFTREGALEQGLGAFFKKALSGEVNSFMKVEGQGRVYLADKGKKVQVLYLQNETVFVNGNDLLALDAPIAYEVTMMKSVSGMLSGGLFNVRLSGTGFIALTSHYDPLTLRVEPGRPVFTDPNATVAWSGSLTPEIKTDISLKTLFGRGSGESFQLAFQGDGWVVIQPYEEVYNAAQQSS